MNNYYDLNDPPDFTNDLLIEKYMNNLSNLENLDLTQLSLEPCSSNIVVENVPSIPSIPNVSKIIRKTINIDSRFRDNYYNSKSSNFHIDLPETFKKIVAIEFSAYTIPISIHSINSSNNYFLIKIIQLQFLQLLISVMEIIVHLARIELSLLLIEI